MKSIKLKITIILLIALLFIYISINYVIPVRIAFALPDKPNWGDLYSNSQGKSICVCSELDNCTPCMTVPD